MALGLGLLLGGQLDLIPFLIAERLLAVAVVGLIVDHQHLLHRHQLAHDPLQHLAFGLGGDHRFLPPTLHELAGALGQIKQFPFAEGVVVGDHDPGLAQLRNQILRHQLHPLEVALGVVRHQHP